MNYTESTVEFSMDGQKFKFIIFHNIPAINGPINSLEAAVYSWVDRTYVYTGESLCEYINSKGIHEAYTKEQFKQLKNGAKLST